MFVWARWINGVTIRSSWRNGMTRGLGDGSRGVLMLWEPRQAILLSPRPWNSSPRSYSKSADRRYEPRRTEIIYVRYASHVLWRS